MPVFDPVLDESPSTEIALPETVTGASAATTACVPETIPSTPVVVGATPNGAASGTVGAAVVPWPADESPSTLMALEIGIYLH